MDGRRRALIVVGSEYQDPGLHRLRPLARDVGSLARVLGDPEIGGFDAQTLFNESAQSVNEAIKDFFAEARPEDLLLLYFSCYCLTDEAGDLYFAVSDTRLRRLAATALSADFINRQMGISRSRQIVLLLDCSYAGAIEQGMRVRAARAVHIGALFGGAGRAVISASSAATEYALEDAVLAEDRQ